MTTFTARLLMAPLQFKIRQRVIECLRIELNDILFAAFVICVAVLALYIHDVRPFAVHPLLFSNIPGYFLMAI